MSLPQNRCLEDLFDLESTAEPHSGPRSEPGLPQPLSDTLGELDKIERALPAVVGLDAADDEIDDLAQRARESFDDLMNLGMQVDSRYASEIFGVASQMLGHAITAKTAKINKKLRMIDLQMKKLRLDSQDDRAPRATTAQGRILDRNELLRLVAGRDLGPGAQG